MMKKVVVVIMIKGLLDACADRKIGQKMIRSPISNGSGALAGSQIVNVKGKIAAVADAA